MSDQARNLKLSTHKRGGCSPMIEHVFPQAMLLEREKQLITALSACAGAYYDFNVTKNVILGTPIQVIDGVAYSIHEAVGLPPHCPYMQVVEFWGNKLAPEEQPAFFDFFDVENLKRRYAEGKRFMSHTYWTKDVLGNPMLAEQTIQLYEDSTNGDILAITFVKDLKPLDELAAKERQARKEAEAALKLANNANKAKSTFLFNMSHDIRTPMNAIMGFANIIAENVDNPLIVQDAIAKVQKSSNILLTLLNEVLDLARIESGKQQLDSVPCDLSKLLQNIRSILESNIESANLCYEIINQLDNPLVICDQIKINQIMLNLLSNAIKFTPKGGHITFGIKQSGAVANGMAEYCLVVKDTGIGMSESFQKRAFNAFEKERSATDSGIEGTGLGLAIVKKLVDLMDGHMEMRSELGQGTEFAIYLRLPVLQAMTSKPCPTQSKNSDQLKGKRILLVEDNELNREIANLTLTKADMLVEEAENGMIAVDKLINAQPDYYDLVLMDIQMPIMDGYKATQEIRSLPQQELANIPIVAMTANSFDDDKRKAFEVGMNAHVAKPINVPKLLKVLSGLLVK